MKLQAFFTADLRSVISIPILRTTGGEYAHVGLLFTCGFEEFLRVKASQSFIDWHGIGIGPDGQYRFYFESIHAKDERTGKNGVRGPYSFTKILAWEMQSEHHKLDILDINCNNIGGMIPFLYKATQDINYARYQIWRNWLSFRLGYGIPVQARSREKWTCSETVVRTVREFDRDYAVDVFDIGEYLLEEYPPSSSGGLGIYELIKERGL